MDWSHAPLLSGGRAGLYTHAVHAALRAGARIFFRVWEDYASDGVRGRRDSEEEAQREETKGSAARREQWQRYHEDHNAKAFLSYVAAVGELAAAAGAE